MENKKYHIIPEEFFKKEIDELSDEFSECDNIVKWRYEDIQKQFPSEEINKQEWISVDKAKPDYDSHYLCLVSQIQECGSIRTFQAVIENKMNQWYELGNNIVTHWQPLPEKPKQL